MSRYETLKNILDNETCFKIICGAGNENLDQVYKLAMVYTLAGADILDISANVEVVKSCMAGIDHAFSLQDTFNIEIEKFPFVMISLGMPGDPHVRKARMNEDCLASACEQCIPVCKVNAISNIKDYIEVDKSLCIGCGICENVCPINAINFYHDRKELEQLIPACLDLGVECIELHAAIENEESTLKEWILIQELNPNNYNSLCLDRLNLGNYKLEQRVANIKRISGDKLIIQADGYPMSGGKDDYNTTLQAIATADVINKKFNVPIILSGGTNSKTHELAKLVGVGHNGVAIGSYARAIIEEQIKEDNFINDIPAIFVAVVLAKTLIQRRCPARTID
jgi:Fe-S-cluster-containing hydrogenase component 2